MNNPETLHDALRAIYKYFLHICITQMTGKAGINKHGAKAIAALFAIRDVKGAYLLADQDDSSVIKFKGESVDIPCRVDPKY